MQYVFFTSPYAHDKPVEVFSFLRTFVMNLLRGGGCRQVEVGAFY